MLGEHRAARPATSGWAAHVTRSGPCQQATAPATAAAAPSINPRDQLAAWTATGTSELVVVPLPSWPSWLSPQQTTWPVDSTAQTLVSRCPALSFLGADHLAMERAGKQRQESVCRPGR